MRKLTRRTFIELGVSATVAATVLPAFAAKSKVKFKVGVTDWNLKQEDKVESVALAKSLGFDGVQVSIGKVTDGKLPLSDPALQKTFLDESKRVDLPIESLCLEMLHRNYLKSDPLGQRWVADSIPIAKAMGVRVILLPFFGKGALETTAEMDKVGDILKEVAPAAEKSGVILGLEDTNSARDNVQDDGAKPVAGRSHLLRRGQLDQERLQRSGRDSLAGRGAHLRSPSEGQSSLPRRRDDRLQSGDRRPGGHRLRRVGPTRD